MLSIERTKQILKAPNMSDEEAEIVRDEYRALAEVIFEQWLHNRQLEKQRNADTKTDK